MHEFHIIMFTTTHLVYSLYSKYKNLLIIGIDVYNATGNLAPEINSKGNSTHQLLYLNNYCNYSIRVLLQ